MYLEPVHNGSSNLSSFDWPAEAANADNEGNEIVASNDAAHRLQRVEVTTPEDRRGVVRCAFGRRNIVDTSAAKSESVQGVRVRLSNT